MKSFRYQNFIDQKNSDLAITGIALRAELKRSVNRSGGISGWSFLYFYNPVTLSAGKNVFASRKAGFTVLPPSTPHSFGRQGTEPSMLSWLYFSGPASEKILSECRIPTGVFQPMERFDVFEKYFLRIYHELSECPYQDSRIINCLFDLLFREVSREIFCHAALDIPSRIRNIYNIVTSIPPRQATLSLLSETAGMSPSHLSSEFRRFYGMSPIAAGNAHRLNYAKYLLSDSNHNVSDVAEAAGYGDVYQFSKAFKKFFGYPPSRQLTR